MVWCDADKRSDADKTNLIEEGKKIGINEVINRNKFKQSKT